MRLRLDRISKTYFRSGNPVAALDDVSLEVEPGQLVAVLGGRGSGKTTLLKVAAGLERPDSGHVSIDGKRLDQFSDRELTALRRNQIGCVWSSPIPIGRSVVLDLVALPLRLQSGDGRTALVEADRALRAVDAGHLVGARLNEISDGERQLVAVAQALVGKPHLLMLDRPAANLSIGEERALLDVLNSLASDVGVAILMTAGNATEAVTAHLIASIHDGRLFAGESVAKTDPDGANVLSFETRRQETAGGKQDA